MFIFNKVTIEIIFHKQKAILKSIIQSIKFMANNYLKREAIIEALKLTTSDLNEIPDDTVN